MPGAPGNSGLAAHRDSYFRALKDIADGDAIEIVTRDSILTYRVERTWIVAPDRRVGARPDANAGRHARHVLPVLFHRISAAALHRARARDLRRQQEERGEHSGRLVILQRNEKRGSRPSRTRAPGDLSLNADCCSEREREKRGRERPADSVSSRLPGRRRSGL